MSNMKNAYRLTVAVGDVPEEVLMHTCRDFALDYDLHDGEVNLSTINNERTVAYYEPYDSPVPSDIVVNALGCLHDHINNVPESELRDRLESEQYHCCNIDHIRNTVWCADSQPDCIHCNVYSFVYYAQDCVVSVYYVTKV